MAMNKSALYYPHINFIDNDWLKAMSMFYERIYRIVPDKITPNDNPELQPLLEDGLIGEMIDPMIYSKDASEEFLDQLGDWSAAALTSNKTERYDLSKLHRDKTDENVKRLFREIGYKETDEWFNVPTDFVSNYMLYLARDIAIKNKLNLITNHWAPLTATSYFNLNGWVDEFLSPFGSKAEDIYDPFALFSLIVSEITPINIGDIPANEIVKFRNKRRDEISNFRESIFALLDELQNLEDPGIRIDLIKDKIRDFKTALKNYHHSADIIKAKGWFGISFMGFAAPITLAKLLNLPVASTVILVLTGLAVGGIFNVYNTKEELKKLQQSNPISCLFELRKSFRKYTSFRGGGDMNFHAYNCMEEYVNDWLFANL